LLSVGDHIRKSITFLSRASSILNSEIAAGDDDVIADLSTIVSHWEVR